MTATQSQLTPDEVADKGKALYERSVRDLVQRAYFVQYVVIDVETGRTGRRAKRLSQSSPGTPSPLTARRASARIRRAMPPPWPTPREQ